MIVFYLSKTQSAFQEIARSIDNAEFHKGLEKLPHILQREEEGFFEKNKVCIIFEDLAIKAMNSELVSDIFTCYTHHLPLAATIITTQSLFQRTAKFQTIIARNFTHMIFTKSMKLVSVFPYVGKELFPENSKKLYAAFKECMKISNMITTPDYKYQKYPYLIVTVDPEDELVQCYSGIFPGEHLRIFVFTKPTK